MNNKTAKLIRREVQRTHGIDKYIEIEGTKMSNPQFKKICRMIRDEYMSLPHNKKAKFKKEGI